METLTQISFPPLGPVVPELFLVGLGVLLVGIDLFSREQRTLLPWVTAAGTLVALVLLFNSPGGSTFGGMFLADPYSVFFKAVCLLGLLFTVLISGRYLEIEEMNHGEYYSLLVFAAAGMMVMASATDLISLYLALELMALSVYCLVGLLKKDPRSNEAAMKYFLMGAFSSAILLYGVSLVYGLTGTTDLAVIVRRLADLHLSGNHALLAGLGLIMVAFGFKVAAAPFHMWTPDAYEGAPTSITAFMSVGPKAASFAVLGRILIFGFPASHPQWGPLLAGIALLTMAIGNIVALSQRNIKRMLAYSSIAHAGYALLGVLAGTDEGLSATMNYLLVYALMNMGTFAVVILLGSKGERRESLDDYKGLAKTNPVIAALMLVFMFSLTGIPPTAGFVGKFYLLMAAVHAGYTGVVIAAVIFSAISAFFYLRVVRYMYMEEAEQPLALAMPTGLAAALALAVLGVIGLGIVPASVLGFASRALIVF